MPGQREDYGDRDPAGPAQCSRSPRVSRSPRRRKMQRSGDRWSPAGLLLRHMPPLSASAPTQSGCVQCRASMVAKAKVVTDRSTRALQRGTASSLLDENRPQSTLCRNTERKTTGRRFGSTKWRLPTDDARSVRHDVGDDVSAGKVTDEVGAWPSHPSPGASARNSEKQCRAVEHGKAGRRIERAP